MLRILEGIILKLLPNGRDSKRLLDQPIRGNGHWKKLSTINGFNKCLRFLVARITEIADTAEENYKRFSSVWGEKDFGIK